MLGIKTIHFPNDQITCDEIRNGKYKLSILNTYQGITDIPIAPYYAQLDNLYPGSKFILTIRDLTSWLTSVEEHWRVWRQRDQKKSFTDFVCACVYGTLVFNPDRFRHVYETHIRNVCDYFANRPEDFIVLNITAGDGWEQLCPFLGVPIPQRSFPLSNSGTEANKWLELVDRAIVDISKVVPKGKAFALIDDGKLGDYLMAAGEAIRFPVGCEHHGVPPQDDRSAIRELERLASGGVDFLVFAWVAFWWIEHYTEFYRYVRSHYHCMCDNERVILFSRKKPVDHQ